MPILHVSDASEYPNSVVKVVCSSTLNVATIDRWGTIKKAEESLKTLKNCTGCVDCNDCEGCTDCVDCQECNCCSNCNFCQLLLNCSNCANCSNSVECHHCESVEYSVKCNGCRNVVRKMLKRDEDGLKNYVESEVKDTRRGKIKEDIYLMSSDLKELVEKGVAVKSEFEPLMPIWREKGTIVHWDKEDERWMDEDGCPIFEQYVTQYY